MTTGHVGARNSDPVPRALGELAKIVYGQRDLHSILDEVAAVALGAVPGADAVSVTLIEDDQPTTAVFTDALALKLDERQYAHGYGPCMDAARGGEVMHVQNMATELRWPEYVVEAVALGGRSSVSVPLPMQQAVLGALNVYATTPSAFDAESIEIARTFGGYAAVALSNARLFARTARLADEMREALASRAAIDQAKGVLMALHGGTADVAFSRMVSESQRRNIKVRDIAREIVSRASTSAGNST